MRLVRTALIVATAFVAIADGKAIRDTDVSELSPKATDRNLSETFEERKGGGGGRGGGGGGGARGGGGGGGGGNGGVGAQYGMHASNTNSKGTSNPDSIRKRSAMLNFIDFFKWG
ncbi:hypothetical protein CCR75_002864 [Bremia lactucae]|uniref:Uncharacterized protein n=1 Tax=Bremia lactucae TaxID=4779 RepID=A0A976FMM5_BRELC|nr:hypothetical protein CCR75_002864 [Bremia lactucae]